MKKTYSIQVTIVFDAEVEADSLNDAENKAIEEAIIDSCFETTLLDVTSPEIEKAVKADIESLKQRKAYEISIGRYYAYHTGDNWRVTYMNNDNNVIGFVDDEDEARDLIVCEMLRDEFGTCHMCGEYQPDDRKRCYHCREELDKSIVTYNANQARMLKDKK